MLMCLNRQLRAARIRIRRCDEREFLRTDLLDQEFEIAGKFHRFCPERFHPAGLVENRERRAQRCHRKNWRITNLPTVRGCYGKKLRLEMQSESCIRIISEPAGKPR